MGKQVPVSEFDYDRLLQRMWCAGETTTFWMYEEADEKMEAYVANEYGILPPIGYKEGEAL